MDEQWTKAVKVVGVAAAVLFVVNMMSKSKKEGGGGGEAKTRDMHVMAELVKNPEAVPNYIKATENKTASVPAKNLEQIGDIAKYMAFKSEYKTTYAARPDILEGELIKVTDWKLLTPKDYDRTCFHFEVDVSGTSMEHTVDGSEGKALSVFATNNSEAVTKFMKEMKIDPYTIVTVEEIAPPEEEGTAVLTSVEKLLTNYLDLFGKPTRDFLKKLFPFAIDVQEKVAIAELTLDRKMEEFQDRQARAYTFADYMTEFKSLRIPADKYVDLVPTIKQRVYSICSSTAYRPGKCQLLVVQEDWQAKGGETKFGLCSSYLTHIRPGSYCVAHSTHSVMNMPEDKMAHIFMAGLGTGLAPFRAFVEKRSYYKKQGHQVGEMTLFFGGRYSKAEGYYGDEFDAFEADKIVKCCNAWSRDTAKKVYVQHKIMEEGQHIWRELGTEGSTGYFFLCGSKQPEKDVFAAIKKIFQEVGGMSVEQSEKKMDQLQSIGRYVTEVY